MAALTLHPVGDASVQVVIDYGDAAQFMVVSRERPCVDPVLGPTGWLGGFLQRALLAGRAVRGTTTLHGLPAGEISVSAFLADSNPGFGSMTVELKSGETASASLPVIASWANAHRDPPEELRPLVEWMEAHADLKPVLMAAYQQAGHNPRQLWKGDNPVNDLLAKLKIKVDLGEHQEVLFADVLAAEGYMRLRARRKKR